MNQATSQLATEPMILHSPAALAAVLRQASLDNWRADEQKRRRLDALCVAWLEIIPQLPTAPLAKQPKVFGSIFELPAASFVGPTPPRHAVIQREQ